MLKAARSALLRLIVAFLPLALVLCVAAPGQASGVKRVNVIAHGQIFWHMDTTQPSNGLILYIPHTKRHSYVGGFFKDPKQIRFAGRDYAAAGLRSGPALVDSSALAVVQHSVCPQAQVDESKAYIKIVLPLPDSVRGLRSRALDAGTVLGGPGCASKIHASAVATIVVFTFTTDPVKTPQLLKGGHAVWTAKVTNDDATSDLHIYAESNTAIPRHQRPAHSKMIAASYNRLMPALALVFENTAAYSACVPLPADVSDLHIRSDEMRALSEVARSGIPCTEEEAQHAVKDAAAAAQKAGDHSDIITCIPIGDVVP